ncbi:MAG: hypothetical protein RR086_03395, partial [Clostridia bacterium]
MKYNKIIIFCFAMILALTLIILVSPSEVTYAETASSLQQKIDSGAYSSYTDSDCLLGKSATIVDYAGTQNEWKLTNALNNYDNAITEIVPREMFETVGTYLCVGKEYGFYVNTISCSKNQNVWNVSTVLVFDIKYDTSVKLDGTYEVSVQNLFCHDYFYLTRTDSASDFKYYVQEGLNGYKE